MGVTADRRAVGLVVGCAGSCGLLSWLAWPSGAGWGDLLTRPPEQSLPLLLCLAMSAVSAWVVLLVALGIAARVPGCLGQLSGRAFRSLAPAVVRRGVEVMLGATTVLAVTAGAAQAAAPLQQPATAAAQVPAAQVPATQVPAARAAAGPPLLAGLDRPATPILNLDRPAARSPVPQEKSATVTVRAGDSLWRIAERSLPPGAGERAIEHAWHRWYDANRGVIGADPNLLQPGQQLVPPHS